jgi:hypothetical protein
MSPRAWLSMFIASGLIWGVLIVAAAEAKCRTDACWDRIRAARAQAWLKEHRPAVFYWRREPLAWRQWAKSTAWCESGNRPHIATGNGFYGWLQFMPRTWFSAMYLVPAPLKTDKLPHLLRAEHQGVVAIRFAMRHGRGHWPVCGR